MRKALVLLAAGVVLATLAALLLCKRPWERFATRPAAAGGETRPPVTPRGISPEGTHATAERVSWMRTASGWAELRNSNYITAILAERDVVWFGTSGGIRYYRRAKEKWGLLTGRDGLPSTMVNDLSGKGRWLWAATNNGLVRVDKQSLAVKVYTTKEGLSENSIISIKADSAGVWLLYGNVQSLYVTGSCQAGSSKVSYLNANEGTVKNYQLQGNRVTKIGIVGEELWAIADGSIIRMMPSTGKQRVIDQDSVPELETIDLSKAGSISAHGRFVLVSAPSLDQRKSELLSYDRRTGEWMQLEQWYISTMVSAGGLFWVGASYDILNASDFVVKYIKDFESEWKDVLYFRNGMLTALAPDSGGVWIGTSNSLIYCSVKKKTIDAYTFEPRINTWNMMDNGFVRLQSSRYGLLIVRYGEIVLFDTERGTYKPLTDVYGVRDICVRDSYAFCSTAGDDYEGRPVTVFRITIDTANALVQDMVVATDLENPPCYSGNGDWEDWRYRLAGDRTGLWSGRGWLTRDRDAEQDTAVHGLFRYSYAEQAWSPVELGTSGLKSDYVRGLASVRDEVWMATDEALYRRGKKGWQRMLDGEQINPISSGRSLFAVHDGKIEKFIGDDQGWQHVCSLSVIQAQDPAILEAASGNVLIGTGSGLWLISKGGRAKMIRHGSTTSLVEHLGEQWAVISGDLYQVIEKGDSMQIIRPSAREICNHEIYRFGIGEIPEFPAPQ